MAQESKYQHTDIESWSKGGNGRIYNGNHVKFTGSSIFGSYSSSYGTKLITSGQHEWTIKSTFSSRSCQWIGIASDFTVLNDRFDNKPYAILWCNGCQEIQGNIGNGHQYKLTPLNPVEGWQSGDRITIKLDLTAHTVSFHLNGNSKPHAIYTNLPHAKYKVAVYGKGYRGDEYTIISSKSGGIAPISNTKCRDCNKLKKANKALRDEMTLKSAMMNSLKEENQSLKRKNDALKASNIKSNQHLKQQNKTLRQQNENLTAEIALKSGVINSLNEQITKFTSKMAKLVKEKNDIVQVKDGQIQQIKARYNVINASNLRLSEECKDLQSDLQQMTVKYEALLRKSKIDEKEFMKWDADTICDWIISLDAKYGKYEEKLRKELNKEQVDGSLLCELDKNDLGRCGIESFRDKVDIVKRIKILVNQQQAQQAQFENDEGNHAAPTAYI